MASAGGSVRRRAMTFERSARAPLSCCSGSGPCCTEQPRPAVDGRSSAVRRRCIRTAGGVGGPPLQGTHQFGQQACRRCRQVVSHAGSYGPPMSQGSVVRWHDFQGLEQGLRGIPGHKPRRATGSWKMAIQAFTLAGVTVPLSPCSVPESKSAGHRRQWVFGRDCRDRDSQLCAAQEC